jgi:hypothetical protein
LADKEKINDFKVVSALKAWFVGLAHVTGVKPPILNPRAV